MAGSGNTNNKEKEIKAKEVKKKRTVRLKRSLEAYGLN